MNVALPLQDAPHAENEDLEEEVVEFLVKEEESIVE